MTAVYIGIGHADDSVVTKLFNVEIVLHAAAESGYHSLYFFVFKHSVHARFFYVEYLAAKGKYRLKTPVPALLCRSACGIALYEVNFAKFGVLFRTVGKFAGV